MRLAVDVLQQIVETLKRHQHPGEDATRPLPSANVPRPPAAALAPRLTILPTAEAQRRRRPLKVTVRSITTSGIVLVDSNYWMDGETFLLQLPRDGRHPVSALLCTVTHWQPICSDLFVVSANFVRYVESMECVNQRSRKSFRV
jgi:hypothetical protein